MTRTKHHKTPEVAVIHGTADNSLSFVWLNRPGRPTFARVAEAAWFRDEGSEDDPTPLPEVAPKLWDLWQLRASGQTLAGYATHKLVHAHYPPSIEPIGAPEQVALDFGGVA